MGALILYEAFSLIVAVAGMVVVTVLGLFIGHIIMFESIGIAIAAGCLGNYYLHIHPALCLLIAVAVFVALLFLMNTKIGFWLIGGLMSVLWGLLAAVIVYSGTGKDMVWTYVTWGLGTAVVLLLHMRSKSKSA